MYLMEIDLVTIFPDFFESPLQESLIKRAVNNKFVKIRVHNLRDSAHDRHKSVDDKPFGGGPGMVMMPGPIFECVESLQKQNYSFSEMIVINDKEYYQPIP